MAAKKNQEIEKEVVEAEKKMISVRVCPRCGVPPVVKATARRGAFVRRYAVCGKCGLKMKWDEPIKK